MSRCCDGCGRIHADHPIERVVHRNIYRVHQRVAKSFRRGRVFLAGDAAHVNNPVGGLGLNCGIHDAIEIAETLRAVAQRRGGRRTRSTATSGAGVRSTSNTCSSRPSRTRSGWRSATRRSVRKTSTSCGAWPQTLRLHKQFLMRTSLIESARKAARIA